MFIDVILIGILILANGFFAAAEMSLVTTRRTRLKMLAERAGQMATKAMVTRLDDRMNVNISFSEEMSPLCEIRI